MPSNPASILDSVKKVVGFDADYTEFDLDITMLINSAFGSLQQLGVGGSNGFIISDNTTLWSQYVSSLSYLNMVKHFIFLSVRLSFDPPPTSFALEAIRYQLTELAVRINMAAEHENPPSDPTSSSSSSSTPSVGGTMTTYFAPKTIQLDFASTVTPDASMGNVFYLALTDDCTINAPINGVNSEHITLVLSSGGFAVTWGNGWNFGSIGEPELSSGGLTDIVSAVFRQAEADWPAGSTPGF